MDAFFENLLRVVIRIWLVQPNALAIFLHLLVSGPLIREIMAHSNLFELAVGVIDELRNRVNSLEVGIGCLEMVNAEALKK